MALRVDVSQNRYKEGGRLPLRNQLPAAGLTELRGERVMADLGSEGSRDMGWSGMVMGGKWVPGIKVHASQGDILRQQ